MDGGRGLGSLAQKMKKRSPACRARLKKCRNAESAQSNGGSNTLMCCTSFWNSPLYASPPMTKRPSFRGHHDVVRAPTRRPPDAPPPTPPTPLAGEDESSASPACAAGSASAISRSTSTPTTSRGAAAVGDTAASADRVLDGHPRAPRDVQHGEPPSKKVRALHGGEALVGGGESAADPAEGEPRPPENTMRSPSTTAAWPTRGAGVPETTSSRHAGAGRDRSSVHKSLNTSLMWHPPKTYSESPTSETALPGAARGARALADVHAAPRRHQARRLRAPSAPGEPRAGATAPTPAAPAGADRSGSCDTSSTQVSLKQCCVLEPPNRISLPRHATALCPQRASGTPSAAFAATSRGSSQVRPFCCDAAAAMLTELSPCRMHSEFEKPSKKPCEPPNSATTTVPGKPAPDPVVSVPEHRGNGGSPDACSCSSASGDFRKSSRCRSLKKSARRLAPEKQIVFPSCDARSPGRRVVGGHLVWSGLVWSGLVGVANAREGVKTRRARVTRGSRDARLGSASALRRRRRALPRAGSEREKRRFQKLEKKRGTAKVTNPIRRGRACAAQRVVRARAAARLAREERRGRETHPDGGAPMEVPRGNLLEWSICDVARGGRGGSDAVARASGGGRVRR